MNKFKLPLRLVCNLFLLVFVSMPIVSHAKLKNFISCLNTDIHIKYFSSDSKNLNCSTYIQSTNYTCGPAAVMNILYYYKLLSLSDMNTTTEMRIAKEMGISGRGTTTGQVTAWLRKHGFNVSTGQMVSSTMLVNNINKGVPTIIAYGNHWLIAHGYSGATNPSNSRLIFSDSSNGRTEMPADYIDTMWAVSNLPHRCKGDTGVYIIAVPSGSAKRR